MAPVEPSPSPLSELQPPTEKTAKKSTFLLYFRYYRHHLTNAMRYVHEYQDDTNLIKPPIVNKLNKRHQGASPKDQPEKSVSDFLPDAEGSTDPASTEPASTEIGSKKKELKGLEAYPLWRRSLLFAMLPPYAVALVLTAMTLSYNRAAYENVLSTCSGSADSSALYNSTARVLCTSGLNKHAAALATGLLTCDTIAFISKCVSFLMCLIAYLVHPSRRFNWSRKLGRYAWVMAIAPPYLLLLIFPYRSVVNWNEMAVDMCDNTFSPMLTSQPYMEEMLRNAALEGTIDSSWAEPPTCIVQEGSYASDEASYSAGWGAGVDTGSMKAAALLGAETILVDSHTAKVYANLFNRMHAFSCDPALDGSESDSDSDSESDSCAATLLPIFNTSSHEHHFTALANSTRSCRYAYCKKHKTDWVNVFFNTDRWAFRRRLEKCNSTRCSSVTSLPSSRYVSVEADVAAGEYTVNLLEGWDMLTDALHQQATVQLRTMNLAQYAVGTLMATYAMKLLLVPALSFVQGLVKGLIVAKMVVYPSKLFAYLPVMATSIIIPLYAALLAAGYQLLGEPILCPAVLGLLGMAGFMFFYGPVLLRKGGNGKMNTKYAKGFLGFSTGCCKGEKLENDDEGMEFDQKALKKLFQFGAKIKGVLGAIALASVGMFVYERRDEAWSKWNEYATSEDIQELFGPSELAVMVLSILSQVHSAFTRSYANFAR
jgi:hypothetical protein